MSAGEFEEVSRIAKLNGFSSVLQLILHQAELLEARDEKIADLEAAKRPDRRKPDEALAHEAVPLPQTRARWRLQTELTAFLEEQTQGRDANGLEALILGVQYASMVGVPGDFVEFGSAFGRTAFAIAFALQSYQSAARLYLFDSFEGLPEASSSIDLEHPFVKAGSWSRGACCGATPAQLKEVILGAGIPESRLVIKPGWFSDTLPTLAADTRFSFLHVDCDLYQSAIDVLDCCFGRGFVSDGAIILFDDWNVHASPRSGERRAWREMVEKYSIEFSDEGAYSWHGHRFIVHGYKSA